MDFRFIYNTKNFTFDKFDLIFIQLQPVRRITIKNGIYCCKRELKSVIPLTNFELQVIDL